MRISEIGSVGNYESVSTQNSQTSSVDSVAAVQPTHEAPMHNMPSSDIVKGDKLEINDEMLDKAVEQANKSLKNYDRYIQRAVHEKTKAVMYVMKDAKTNEVIREFPPKKIQDMIAKMWELAGLFVDEKA